MTVKAQAPSITTAPTPPTPAGATGTIVISKAAIRAKKEEENRIYEQVHVDARVLEEKRECWQK